VAVAVAVALSSVPAVSHQTADGRSGPASLSARTVLLMSAKAAARTPVTTGSYWYVSERTVVRARVIRVSGRKVFPVPFTAYVADSQQLWYPTHSGLFRRVAGIDHQLIFASAADEDKWKAMGSPDFSVGYPAQPTTQTYSVDGLHVAVGNHLLTLAQARQLPVTAASLESALHQFWSTDFVKDRNGHPTLYVADFTGYLWQAAGTMLADPITPGIKAALFRLLAAQPGITAQPTTDPMGRSGVSLSVISGGEQDSMIIAPGTGQLLAWEARPVTDGAAAIVSESRTYQSTGWTGQLGVPAGS
jgi:hypothetical protein